VYNPGVKDEHGQSLDKQVWMVLLGILVLFTAVVMYAKYVTLVKREEALTAPVVARYTNYAYGVNLRYPPEWKPVAGYGYDRYEGEGGFFGISAGGADDITIDQMANNEAKHALHPYGTEPYIQKIVIDGQDARLVMPSPDQSPSMKGQAMLIVEYPMPYTVGSETYRFFIFWSDRANIQDIASSITFIRPGA
jgi:hypothetical protein